eukprot:TRINITY_DN861_c0_g1_i17.p1 TRINITY_DN861_c0_g1~~TRINITY_DN861_c0_g1_i17.p1  ORF type:complete len:183 (+),score=45.03 TRINITY_DN861_c0_g1_i17:270-818(+)
MSTFTAINPSEIEYETEGLQSKKYPEYFNYAPINANEFFKIDFDGDDCVSFGCSSKYKSVTLLMGEESANIVQQMYDEITPQIKKVLKGKKIQLNEKVEYDDEKENYVSHFRGCNGKTQVFDTKTKKPLPENEFQVPYRVDCAVFSPDKFSYKKDGSNEVNVKLNVLQMYVTEIETIEMPTM